MNKWFELTLKASSSLKPEELNDALIEAGAVAVTMQDAEDNPIFEPMPGETPLWETTLVTGLFEIPCDREAIKRYLIDYLKIDLLPIVMMKEIEDRDWIGAWQDNFKPIKFGDNLWVCPTHLDKPEPEITTLMLDPGLAFGTGTHPTTALCLEWLSNNRDLYVGREIIDYGCGSGILGIAAKLLGAKACYSTDIDPQALIATSQNAKSNGVNIEVKIVEDFLPPKVTVLLANILANPLITLAPLLATIVEIEGHIILSGLLERDSNKVKTVYQQYFDFEPDAICDGWVRLHGVRRSDD